MKERITNVCCARAKTLIVIAALLALAACQTTGKSGQHLKAEWLAKTFYVIGHRGAAGLAPENTLSSFIRACDVGVHAIELDVHLTANAKIVVHHDYLLSIAVIDIFKIGLILKYELPFRRTVCNWKAIIFLYTVSEGYPGFRFGLKTELIPDLQYSTFFPVLQ